MSSSAMNSYKFAGFGGGGGGRGFGGSGFGGGGGFSGGGGFPGGRFPGGPSGYPGRSGADNSFLGGMLGGLIGSALAGNNQRTSSGGPGNYPPPPQRPQNQQRPPSQGQPGGSPQGTSPGGCGPAIIVIIVLFLLIMIVFAFSGGLFGEDVSASTVDRKPLPAGSVNVTGYYTDDAGIISNATTLETGMRYFYEKTGVQPYLYIEPVNQTTSVSALTDFAEQEYNQLFTDQAHFLVVICPTSNGSYTYGGWIGSQAESILDDEAIQIFGEYLGRYWYDNSLGYAQKFAETYVSTADRIMEVTPNLWIPVIIVVAIVILIIIIIAFIKYRHDQKEREQKRQQEILNTPLEKFGDKDVEDLAASYERSREEMEKESSPFKAVSSSFKTGDEDDGPDLTKFSDQDLEELERKYRDS